MTRATKTTSGTGPQRWRDAWDGPCPVLEAKALLDLHDQRSAVMVERIRRELAEEA